MTKHGIGLVDLLVYPDHLAARRTEGQCAFDSADARSSTLLVMLDPGVYSFIASGKSAASGIVLVEVYDAD